MEINNQSNSVNKIKNIAIFASGNGKTFEAIALAIIDKKIDAQIVALVCDHPNSIVIEKAKHYNIPTLIIDKHKYSNKHEFEEQIVQYLSQFKIDLIFLAYYMRILGSTLLDAYPNKIINIHPSLLPAFIGMDAVKQAYDYGVKFAGITIHYVDNNLDTGKIIEQAIIPITKNMTLDELEAKIKSTAHKLSVETIQYVLTSF